MPVYQYICSKCNTSFELRQSFDDEGVASCPNCNSKVKRAFIPVPIIFKGSGFYCTENSAPSSTQLPPKLDEDSKDTKISKEAEPTKSEVTAKGDNDKSASKEIQTPQKKPVSSGRQQFDAPPPRIVKD